MKFSAQAEFELKMAADSGLWEAIVYIEDTEWVTVLALATLENHLSAPMNATRLSFNAGTQKWEVSK